MNTPKESPEGPMKAREFWIRLYDGDPDESDTIWETKPLDPLPAHIIHVIEHSAYALLSEELKAVKAERDLAIAHDTQPYPTAHAYEMVCKADSNKLLKITELEKANVTLISDWDYQVKMRVELYQENQTLKLKLVKARELFMYSSEDISTEEYDQELSQIVSGQTTEYRDKKCPNTEAEGK